MTTPFYEAMPDESFLHNADLVGTEQAVTHMLDLRTEAAIYAARQASDLLPPEHPEWPAAYTFFENRALNGFKKAVTQKIPKSNF